MIQQIMNRTKSSNYLFGQESILVEVGVEKTLPLSSWIKIISASFTKIFKKLFFNVVVTLAILDYTVNSLSSLIVHSAG